MHHGIRYFDAAGLRGCPDRFSDHHVVTKLFGETEGIKTAIITALAGTIVYTIIYFLLGNGLIAGFMAGVAWLLVLQHFHFIGWIKSLIIAVVVWIVTSVVGMFLPVL